MDKRIDGLQHNVDMNDKIFCMVFLGTSLFIVFGKAGIATKVLGLVAHTGRIDRTERRERGKKIQDTSEEIFNSV